MSGGGRALDHDDFRARELRDVAGFAYLDHALRGPVPRSARAAAARVLRLSGRGALAREALEAEVERARAAVARLLGAAPGEVSFHLNATAAMATLAHAIRWRPGDRVVTTDAEYASTVLPWRAQGPRGVRVDVVPSQGGLLDRDALARALERPARVVALAAVALGSGERRDLPGLATLAHAAGAWLVVDAALALGLHPMSPRTTGVDGLTGCGRKYLLGPPDVGLLWLPAERLAELDVPAPGARSREDALGPLDAPLRLDARRFEGGALPAPLLAGLARSVELLLDAGPERLLARALAVAATIEDRARAAGLLVERPTGSAIVHLRVPGAAPAQGRARLDAAGVVARVLVDGRVRASPHGWNDEGDAARLVAALAPRA